MKWTDVITGFTADPAALSENQLSHIMETQRVRVFQSHQALPLVTITGLVYIYGLWNETSRPLLISWILLISVCTVVRTLCCRYIEKRLDEATVPELYRNEQWLYLTSLCSTLVVGSGYWWVCLPGSDRAVFAVTLLCCIYAIGTTINSSVQPRGFVFLLISTLGQGIVFLSMVREPADIEVSVALLAIIILLVQFGRRNASLFKDSISMRDANRAQNLKLEKDKLIIEKALNAARAANEDKNRFMAAASHDLRQPLHAMTLFMGSLRHVVKDRLAIELLDKIDETSNLLRDQFNSLLDLSKFDAGVVQAEFSDFSLDTMLTSIVDSVRQDARRKKLSLKLETTPVSVHSDHLLLERLLRNLIVNAIKYTERGSIVIRTAPTEKGLLVSVQDSGPGISIFDQGRIFDDYYQVHNPARTKSKGSGLGLAIVKRISLLLDMELSLDSVPGQGSTFSVHIPQRSVIPGPRAEASELIQPVLPDDRLEGMKVLVVDDDTTILDALCGLLRIWGCTAEAATGSEGIRRLLDLGFRPDVAILDDMLDEQLTGLDIARDLVRHLPADQILITTGNMSPTRLQTIRDRGFRVMVKPVNQNVLYHEICQSLQKEEPRGRTG